MTTTASPLAPNPQFRRDSWIDLCGTWGFAHDDDNQGIKQAWWNKRDAFNREIVVPFPPESELSGLRETGFHPVIWYHRTFTTPQVSPGEKLMLNFGAVDYAATVWVNGHCVGTHEGGHVPFALDITHALGEGEQTIVLRAEDPPEDVRIPRGKQDWLEAPHSIWYYRTSGIWQPVWLSVVPDLHLTDIHFIPDVANYRVRGDFRLNTMPTEPVALTVKLSAQGKLLAQQTMMVADSELRFEIALPQLENGVHRDVLLWTPERPNLIDVEIVLEGPQPDRVHSYLGMRSVGAGGQRFLLNGLPYYLRMVLGQNYWPESHLAAPSPEALKREVELIKEMGFNGVRIHQKIEDPRFLYWCDVLGLIVWEEMPSAYSFSNSAIERLSKEWMAAIRRDKSHPCIVAWVPLNESWGVSQIADRPDQQHYASALYHLTKALDPSRPAISNDGWELVESDIWSIHDYAPDGAGLKSRFHEPADIEAMLRGMGPARRRIVLNDLPIGDKPVMLTEFGGLSYLPKQGEKWHGYSTVDNAEDFEHRLRDIFTAIAAMPHIAGYCYTQVTDTEQETNGLLTAAREPKLPLETLRDITTLAAASVPHEQIDSARKKARAAAQDAEPIL
ncbi:glycoside hydrolase family 2 protein [Devosia rhizoryzae]|uniref:Glycoside hydrolase family 2 n=1 Tax=Devosia rhizoryzae TaxID=2774137 RepID=A0ABX7C4C0_9HYPH|nr:sugar-binding domain-containing protein [Devosia rhizoryzae]QQR38653.1 glycoside hydrolase family 2 [Devosia rhizoryzae]